MILAVKITPRARISAFKRYQDGVLWIAIAAIPRDNEANLLLLRFLADSFRFPISQVKLLSGGAGRLKRVSLPLNEKELQHQLKLLKVIYIIC